MKPNPCLVPKDLSQRLDIKCAQCGKPIDFRRAEVYLNQSQTSYVCKDHADE